MLLASSRREGESPRWLRGAVIAIAFAGFEEAGKLALAGRFFNVANVATSAVGAVLGAAADAPSSGR